MIVIQESQISAINAKISDAFKRKLISDIEEAHGPSEMEGGWERLVSLGMEKSEKYNLGSEYAKAALVHLMIIHGPDFDNAYADLGVCLILSRIEENDSIRVHQVENLLDEMNDFDSTFSEFSVNSA